MGQIYNKKTNTFDFGKITIYSKMKYEDFFNKNKAIIKKRFDYFDNSGFEIHTASFEYDKCNYVLDLNFSKSGMLKSFSITIYNRDETVPCEWADFDEKKQEIMFDRNAKWIQKQKIIDNDDFVIKNGIATHDCIPKVSIIYKWYEELAKEEKKDIRNAFARLADRIFKKV